MDKVVATADEAVARIPDGARIMVGGHAHIGTLGWLSLALMGTLYYLVPLLSEKQLSWPRMVNWIFWIEATMIPAVGALMLAAGIKSGMSYDDGLRGTALDDAITPLMLPVGILSIICDNALCVPGMWSFSRNVLISRLNFESARRLKFSKVELKCQT